VGWEYNSLLSPVYTTHYFVCSSNISQLNSCYIIPVADTASLNNLLCMVQENYCSGQGSQTCGLPVQLYDPLTDLIPIVSDLAQGQIFFWFKMFFITGLKAQIGFLSLDSKIQHTSVMIQHCKKVLNSGIVTNIQQNTINTMMCLLCNRKPHVSVSLDPYQARYKAFYYT
jgi:hypothetical protein